MHLLGFIKAKTMEALVAECNMFSLKSGKSYNFTAPLFDGKFFYTTYYFDIEMNEIVAKVSALERRNTQQK
jgi:hypothetical protein